MDRSAMKLKLENLLKTRNEEYKAGIPVQLLFGTGFAMAGIVSKEDEGCFKLITPAELATADGPGKANAMRRAAKGVGRVDGVASVYFLAEDILTISVINLEEESRIVTPNGGDLRIG